MNGSARIKNVSRRADGSVCVSAEVSNSSGSEGVEFVMLEELFSELGADIGEIDGDVLEELDRRSDITCAYFSACSSFAYTQSSINALYKKLICKGFSRDTSLCAIELVRSRGFVDEAEIAVRRAELMTEKLWGRSRIMQKLREEGFPRDVVENVRILLENTDFVENCTRVIKKKYRCAPTDRREKEKMYAALVRMGYTLSEIRSACDLMSDTEV